MPKIADVKKQLDQKIVLLTKNKSLIEKLEKDNKKLAQTQQKLEKSHEKEKDKKKKEKISKEMTKVMAEWEKNKKRIEGYKKISKELPKTIDKLDGQLAVLRAGVVEFGRSRKEYLKWWSKQEVILNKIKDKIILEANNSEADATMAGSAVDSGDMRQADKWVKSAFTHVDISGKTLMMLSKQIGDWKGTWDGQRNLNVQKFGTDASDLKQFDGITKQVYATFKLGDAARLNCSGAVEKGQLAADQAAELVKAGGKNIEYYRSVIAKAQELLDKKAKELNSNYTQAWGKQISQQADRIVKMTVTFQKEPDKFREAALKTFEQANAGMPKALSIGKTVVNQANGVVTKESKKVPVEFQRECKRELNGLRMMMMKMVTDQKKAEGNFAKAMENVKKLGTALGR